MTGNEYGGFRLFRAPSPAVLEELDGAPIAEWMRAGRGADRAEVLKGIEEGLRDPAQIAGLLLSRMSPGTGELLERARLATDAVFGRAVILYAPCYLSSYCVNACTYCGFSFAMKVPRSHLQRHEIDAEIEVLASRGMKRILLVAGEYPSKVSPEYLREAVETARRRVPEVDLEVGPVREDQYAEWIRAGAGGLTCYQETYDRQAYALLHPRGPKSFYEFRLGALERAGDAGMSRLSLGILLGLAEPVRDLLALVVHARHLEGRYPGATLSVSLPRLRPAVPGFSAPAHVDDESLVRFYAALRLALPRAGLVVSTRERPALRKRLLGAGITRMSAGSITAPGGYARGEREGGQFEVADERNVCEVRDELESLGYTVRWTGGLHA